MYNVEPWSLSIPANSSSISHNALSCHRRHLSPCMYKPHLGHAPPHFSVNFFSRFCKERQAAGTFPVTMYRHKRQPFSAPVDTCMEPWEHCTLYLSSSSLPARACYYNLRMYLVVWVISLFEPIPHNSTLGIASTLSTGAPQPATPTVARTWNS